MRPRLLGQACPCQHKDGRTMTTATDELLPCPFCGGEAELRYHPMSMRDPQCRAWEAGCSICDARVGSTIYAIGKTRDEAIAAWNRRADHD